MKTVVAHVQTNKPQTLPNMNCNVNFANQVNNTVTSNFEEFEIIATFAHTHSDQERACLLL